jgi:hypothetical protein
MYLFSSALFRPTIKVMRADCDAESMRQIQFSAQNLPMVVQQKCH